MFWYLSSSQDCFNSVNKQWKIKYLDALSKIERATSFFKELEESKAVVIFKGKLDVSEQPFDIVDLNIKEIERKLLNVGYGIYSIDYTKDFLGTLDRETLTDHFITKHSFRIEETDTKYANQPCILENTRSAGANIVTYAKSVSTHLLGL